MAKTMAQIQDSTVINMIWCSDGEPQTPTLIDPGDRPVGIGDTWDGENFYRNGEKILTPLEGAQEKLAEYEAALAEIEAALGGDHMTIEERKARILAKIQEMQAEGKDMAQALSLLGYSETEVLTDE